MYVQVHQVRFHLDFIENLYFIIFHVSDNIVSLENMLYQFVSKNLNNRDSKNTHILKLDVIFFSYNVAIFLCDFYGELIMKFIHIPILYVLNCANV